MMLSAPLIVLALLIVAEWKRRGYLQRDALAAAPPRNVVMGFPDIAVGVMLMFLGMVALGNVLKLMGLPLEPPPESQPIDAWNEARRSLLSQLVVEMPVVLFVIARAARQPDGLHELGVLSRRPGRAVWTAGVALLATIPLVFAVSLVSVAIGERLGFPAPRLGHEMLRAMSESRSPTAVAMLLTSAILLAPLLEEVIFRGLMQTALLNRFGREHRWSVMFVAAAIFAAIHFSVASVQALPALLLLGLILGWLYERTGSLLPGILLHAGFNAINAGWTILFASANGGS